MVIRYQSAWAKQVAQQRARIKPQQKPRVRTQRKVKPARIKYKISSPKKLAKPVLKTNITRRRTEMNIIKQRPSIVADKKRKIARIELRPYNFDRVENIPIKRYASGQPEKKVVQTVTRYPGSNTIQRGKTMKGYTYIPGTDPSGVLEDKGTAFTRFLEMLGPKGRPIQKPTKKI